MDDLDHLTEPEEKEIWLLTYADMVTLLLAIFLVIAAMSTVDPNKFEEVQEAFNRSVSHHVQARPLHQLKQELDEVIRQHHLEQEVKVALTRHGLNIVFMSSVFFDEGQSDLLPGAQQILTLIASPLQRMAPNAQEYEVQGHTDDKPIETSRFHSNWELSSDRAATVVQFLLAHGIPPTLCRAEGLAATEPIRPNRDAQGHPIPANQAANRRVVIKVDAVR